MNGIVNIYKPRGITSHGAVNRVRKILGIKKEEVACIGDGENDLPMFEASGMKFAMGNAVDVLKEKADYLLPSNNEDGVAFAVNEYILKNK